MAAVASAAERAAAKHAAMVAAARARSEDFVEFAIRNDSDGSRIQNAWFHREWHQAMRSHAWLVIRAPVEHGKTIHVIGKVLHALGTNPNARLALISNTARQAEKILSAVKQHIERNPRVREVFPHLVPGAQWNSEAITVKRDTISKDPSIQALGVGGPLVGSRLDGIVVDDILDFENTRNAEQRAKVLEWLDTIVFPRGLAGSWLVFVGTPWHPEDALHVLPKRPGFHGVQYSAVRNPDQSAEHWVTIWPQQWPLKRLLLTRSRTTISAFQRKYLCRTTMDGAGRFLQAWLDDAVRLGRGLPPEYVGAPMELDGTLMPTFTGVDLAIGDKEESALTVLCTIALTRTGRRILVNMQSGRWTAPEIVQRLEETQARFGSLIAVESNGAQKYIVQWSEGRFPVRGLHTGANKFSERFGVESLAIELRRGRWVIPSGNDGASHSEDAKELFSEMLHYSPDAHTGDRLMAAWIAREAARQWAAPMYQRFDLMER